MNQRTVIKYKKWINGSTCSSPDDLLIELGIKVIRDERMKEKDFDAFLVKIKKKFVIYIKPNLGKCYEDFILTHESAHTIWHAKQDMYLFNQAQYTSKLETEANVFACLYLLKDDDLCDCNVIQILENKGVPYQIAVQFYEVMQNIINV